MKSIFHPAVDLWFSRSFAAPTPAQAEAWPAIQSRSNVLIAAPTGSGKTLAAFLAAIDGLVRQALTGSLPDATQIVYVSPLKALSNDIQKNLEAPLSGIRATLRELGYPDVELRAWVRTGDTPASERSRTRRLPPHIVVTTPESLYILLGSESGRTMLSTTNTVIVDEIHAVAGNKRGAHLALSLERLSALCQDNLLRVGLSATQKPIEDIAQYLVGTGPKESPAPSCRIVDSGHIRTRDLGLEIPPAPLEAVMSGEVWKSVYDRLAALIKEHRTTLIFVNTRRMVERACRELGDRLGEENVAAHHGSLSKEHRLDAERRLKRGKLRAMVATASLELGIDIGDVDLVCQIGSPRSIASWLQRVGRSGHAIGATPKGRIFPLSRDELVECAALLDAVRRGELDRLDIPEKPLDVLAQQLGAEIAAQEWKEDELFGLFKRAWPFRNLPREEFSVVLEMLAEGFSTGRGRRGALIHHDAVNGMVRGRRGTRLTAITSGGAIPDNADYRVIQEPENTLVGTLHEDFAVESLAGDVFQLGNQSYRILRVERGVVRVEDARGQPPTIPFWLGEAPGRSNELSYAVSRLRETVGGELDRETPDGVMRSLMKEVGLNEPAAEALVEYLAMGKAALGCLPTQNTIVLERFFDESGGMQLVIHSPYGSRINRAWGLALRKRFCRTFNFELQAAATEDNIVLSLTASHSFELGDVQRYLNSTSARSILIQALLDAPMFVTRWRWVAGIALALPRFRGGKKRPPQILRMEAEDLLASVFPDQLACIENLTGTRDVPDHPLVNQAIEDCLHEAMDVDGLERILGDLESGAITVIARDLAEPSPLALEVLSARPYAYLDDAPLEERRTQAVMGRRWLSPEDAADIGRLDPEAIVRVRAEVWPDARSEDELHDSLVWFGFLSEAEARASAEWPDMLARLAHDGRATRVQGAQATVWIAAERAPQFQALWPRAAMTPPVTAPKGTVADWTPETALVEIVRGRLEGQGPITASALAPVLGVTENALNGAFLALQTEGFALRGRYSSDAVEDEWCERRLLARINRYTVKRLRAEIEPVAPKDFLRFLLAWQHLTPEARMEGPNAVTAIVEQLEGFEVPASAWETEVLPARIAKYGPSLLDDQCRAGRVTWTRLKRRDGTGPAPVRTTPITLLPRRSGPLWNALGSTLETAEVSTRANAVMSYMYDHGASFFDELVDGTGLLRAQVEDALAELVGLGLVSADSFAGLRVLILPKEKRRDGRRRGTRMEDAGRWVLTKRRAEMENNSESTEHIARTLLKRYGVVFWKLLERESSLLPPWRDLIRVYRRLEARGEIRGGRFVATFSGEQYALPDAVAALRDIRRTSEDGTLITVSGADPLNLAGILTPGAKLSGLTNNRLLYRDGVPIAWLAGGQVTILDPSEAQREWELRKLLLQGTARHSVTTESLRLPRRILQHAAS
jgi:ATP-dependent helicase Lhr and Lhr-like helicase